MRHKVYGKKLGRDKNQRAALLKNLISSLILHGSIETTETKAKAIKGLVDKIINQAKTKETQRLLQTFLTQKPIVEKLVKEVVPSLKSRNSGYTSTVKLGQRYGDNAMIVRMSLLSEEIRSDQKNQIKSEKTDTPTETDTQISSDLSEKKTRRAKK